MFKIVLLVKRKTGLSKQAFQDYYEANHAPLAEKHMPKLAAYKRTYLSPLAESQTSPDDFDLSKQDNFQDYDVYTEFYWANQTDFEEAMAFMQSDKAKVFVEDEQIFMDRATMTFYSGQEFVSNLSQH